MQAAICDGIVPDEYKLPWLFELFKIEKGNLSFNLKKGDTSYSFTYKNGDTSFTVYFGTNGNEIFWLTTQKMGFNFFGARIGDTRENILKNFKSGRLDSSKDDSLVFISDSYFVAFNFRKNVLYQISLSPVY